MEENDYCSLYTGRGAGEELWRPEKSGKVGTEDTRVLIRRLLLVFAECAVLVRFRCGSSKLFASVGGVGTSQAARGVVQSACRPRGG